MKNFIETLRGVKTGYGHYKISIEISNQKFTTTTTNMPAIDAAFDDCYDDMDNSGRFYETREKAQLALIEEISESNDLHL